MQLLLRGSQERVQLFSDHTFRAEINVGIVVAEKKVHPMMKVVVG